MARITVSAGSTTLRLDTAISPTRAPATVTAEPGRIKVALIAAAQKVHLWLPGHAWLHDQISVESPDWCEPATLPDIRQRPLSPADRRGYVGAGLPGW